MIVLAIFYWIHLLATITWLGGLVVLVWASLTKPNLLIETVERHLRPVGLWASAALLVTGMIQMGANESYLGMFRLANLWSAALFAKHILFGGMLAVTAYAQWQVGPELDRLKILDDKAAVTRYRSRLKLAAYVNLALGVLILLFTSIMTATTT